MAQAFQRRSSYRSTGLQNPKMRPILGQIQPLFDFVACDFWIISPPLWKKYGSTVQWPIISRQKRFQNRSITPIKPALAYGSYGPRIMSLLPRRPAGA